MQEWPLKSKLDPKIYGPQESAITTELIEREIKGVMTVEEVANSILLINNCNIIIVMTRFDSNPDNNAESH